MGTLDYDDLIQVEQETTYFCKLCNQKFKTLKEAKKHTKSICKTHWLAFTLEEYKMLKGLIRSLTANEEYAWRFKSGLGLGILYSIENVMTRGEAEIYL